MGTDEPAEGPPRPVQRTIVFRAPRDVVVMDSTEELRPGPGEVLVEGIASAISAGTEMLVYRGQMPGEEIGSTGERAPFAYPAAYGYSHVGRIAEVGEGVDTLRVGQRVFCFKEHTTHYLAPVAEVMPIPSNVADFDACFFPNVETALSIAMDAAPLPGEAVMVFGQGIVGLLVTKVLRTVYPTTRIVTVDPVARRRFFSSRYGGASISVSPKEATLSNERVTSMLGSPLGADICIELTGHGAGLNSAIAMCRKGGKVVVGSWYGTKDVTLGCLGANFHRSHMTLVASQVSTIPAPLSARWDKDRRFSLVWHLLPILRPSTAFTVGAIHVTDIDSAPQVYKEVHNRAHLQVIFNYGPKA